MSEFSILYQSLHRDQSSTKKVEEKTRSTETKSNSKHEVPSNLFRTLISKIF